MATRKPIGVVICALCGTVEVDAFVVGTVKHLHVMRTDKHPEVPTIALMPKSATDWRFHKPICPACYKIVEGMQKSYKKQIEQIGSVSTSEE